MSPSAVDVVTEVHNVAKKAIETESQTKYPEPLKLSGALDSYEYFDTTPIIGREYPNANLVDILNSPNSDELIRDLAITSR